MAKDFLSVDDLKDIQAGPVVPIPTRSIDFRFFTITNVDKFREVFGQKVLGLITTSDGARGLQKTVKLGKGDGNMVDLAGINVSFSQKGLAKLGLFGESPITGDAAFGDGQYARASDLGDNVDKDWLNEFKPDANDVNKNVIHGLFQVTGNPEDYVKKTAGDMINNFLAASAITVVFEHMGRVRSGLQKGHEHFGFNDGISQPFVKFTDDDAFKRESLPGQAVVDPGVLILKQTGDDLESKRPDWAKNGSFLVYRHLKQLVPEFDAFLKNTVEKPNSTIFGQPTTLGDTEENEKRANFLGARLMGRWKSGLPVVKTSFVNGKIPEDHPAIGVDPMRNNDFNYGYREEQDLCPFAAHTRKTGPRTDIKHADAKKHMIVRGGIPYGPEVKDTEKLTTIEERGLSFVCYQSSVVNGFEFIQKDWSNNPDFPSTKAGFDPIIGQNKGNKREMTGYDVVDPGKQLELTNSLAKELEIPKQFIISQGGEYFFLPSMTTLKQILPKK